MKSKRPQLIKKKRKKRKKLESDLKERAQKGPRASKEKGRKKEKIGCLAKKTTYF